MLSVPGHLTHMKEICCAVFLQTLTKKHDTSELQATHQFFTHTVSAGSFCCTLIFISEDTEYQCFTVSGQNGLLPTSCANHGQSASEKRGSHLINDGGASKIVLLKNGTQAN